MMRMKSILTRREPSRRAAKMPGYCSSGTTEKSDQSLPSARVPDIKYKTCRPLFIITLDSRYVRRQHNRDLCLKWRTERT